MQDGSAGLPVQLREAAMACIVALRDRLPAAAWKHVSAIALERQAKMLPPPKPVDALGLACMQPAPLDG